MIRSRYSSVEGLDPGANVSTCSCIVVRGMSIMGLTKFEEGQAPEAAILVRSLTQNLCERKRVQVRQFE